MNKELMLKAAQALVEKVPDSRLNMGCFFDGQNRPHLRLDDDLHCETSACFAGHMPTLGVPGLEVKKCDISDSYGYINFVKYSGRVSELTDLEWEFIFGWRWPNSTEAVKRRVEYLAEHDEAPREFEGYILNPNPNVYGPLET